MLKVIGLGSPFADDQVGWLLIDSLRQTEKLQPYLNGKLELLAIDRPGAGLLSQLADQKRVIIIDAVVTGADLGRLHSWSDPVALESCCSSLSSHGFGLAQALMLGRQLGSLPEQMLILGVEIDPVAIDVDVSLLLQQKIPFLNAQIVEKLLSFLRFDSIAPKCLN